MKVVSVGRSSSNEVVVNDSLVTRERHCVITEENGMYYIFDASSKNGTFVNGNCIPHGTKIKLHHTDVVRIGNTVLPWQSYVGGCGVSVQPPTAIGVPVVPVPPQPQNNGMAIAGFVLSFFFSVLGIIFSSIGLNRANKRIDRKGHGLAVAGIVISSVSIGIRFIVSFLLAIF